MTVLDDKKYVKRFGLVEVFSVEGLLHLRLIDNKKFSENSFSTNVVHKIDGDATSHYKNCDDSHIMTSYDLNENGEIVNIASPVQIVHTVYNGNSKYHYV